MQIGAGLCTNNSKSKSNNLLGCFPFSLNCAVDKELTLWIILHSESVIFIFFYGWEKPPPFPHQQVKRPHQLQATSCLLSLMLYTCTDLHPSVKPVWIICLFYFLYTLPVLGPIYNFLESYCMSCSRMAQQGHLEIWSVTAYPF